MANKSAISIKVSAGYCYTKKGEFFIHIFYE